MTSTPMGVPPSGAEFALAVRQYVPGIARALRYLGVPDAQVGEVAPEVFVSLYRALVTGDERLPLRTLAYRAAVQVASDHRKRSYRRPQPPERASAAAARTARDERLGRLEQALAQLAPVHREVFVLVELEQLPIEEVAAALGVPEKTASGRLHAARVALREAWDDTSHGDPAR